MSYFLGYGHEVWSAGNYYFWVCLYLLPSKLAANSLSKPQLIVGTDSNGRTLLWLHVRRLPLRRLHLHRRITDQYALDGPPSIV